MAALLPISLRIFLMESLIVSFILYNLSWSKIEVVQNLAYFGNAAEVWFLASSSVNLYCDIKS